MKRKRTDESIRLANIGKKQIDLKIHDVAANVDVPRHPPVFHPVLPQHEFAMLIVAPKGSGKTNFICNLLLHHYKEYFHKILVCSPTVNNDEKWEIVQAKKHVLKENKKLQTILGGQGQKSQRKLPVILHDANRPAKSEKFDGRIPESDFFNDMSEVPERVAEQQKIIMQLKKMGYTKHVSDRILIICDDQAGLFKGGNTNNPIVNYVIKHRHSNSSCIFVTQAYKAIPKTIRTNCDQLVLFSIPNLKEREVIYEENPCGLSQEEWMAAYDMATADDYSFMYMNYKFKPGQRMYKNFDQLIEYN